MNALRKVVSGSRKRYKDGKWDLDLTYIVKDRIIAMGFPSCGVEAAYRNPIDQAASMLDHYHAGHYQIFNLAMRPYDKSFFHQRVNECGFLDHNPGPLVLLWETCNMIHIWLDTDPKNVIAVHCMAGKGRTGMVCVCYLMFARFIETEEERGREKGQEASALGEKGGGLSDETHEALSEKYMDYFKTMRGQGVKYPSQMRFVRYFAQLLNMYQKSNQKKALLPPLSTYKASDSTESITAAYKQRIRPFPIKERREVLLRRVLIHNVPRMDGDDRTGYCRPQIRIESLANQLADTHLFFRSDWGGKEMKKYLTEERVKIDANKLVMDDLTLYCQHIKADGSGAEMFHFAFHTHFIDWSVHSYTHTLCTIHSYTSLTGLYTHTLIHYTLYTHTLH
jgi:hypothetical protein